MAEIHVQTKKHNSGTLWIWIVLIVLIAAAAIYFFTRNNKTNYENNSGNQTNTTSYNQLPGQLSGNSVWLKS